MLRWVADADLPAIYRDLCEIGLGDAGAGTIVDITACPGTDTCKLGIASSRGLTAELRTRLIERSTCCPTPCASSRSRSAAASIPAASTMSPISASSATAAALAITRCRISRLCSAGNGMRTPAATAWLVGAVPAKTVPDVLEALTERYVAERAEDENFQTWVKNLGRKEIKAMLQPFTKLPSFRRQSRLCSATGAIRASTRLTTSASANAPAKSSRSSRWRSPKPSRLTLKRLLALDDGDYARADENAYKAMVLAARALVRTKYLDVGDDYNKIVDEFRERFYDTELIYDRFAKGKFARYLFKRHGTRRPRASTKTTPIRSSMKRSSSSRMYTAPNSASTASSSANRLALNQDRRGDSLARPQSKS